MIGSAPIVATTDKLKGVGVTIDSGDAAELAELEPVEHERIAKLIKTANIKAD